LKSGVLGVVWSCIWFRFAHNSPSQHPTISLKEREYIESSIEMVRVYDSPPFLLHWRVVFVGYVYFVTRNIF